MVRKASRLAPGQQSIEEVLLNRLTDEGSNAATTRSSNALPVTRRTVAMPIARAAAAREHLSGRVRPSVSASAAAVPVGPASNTAKIASFSPQEFKQHVSSEIASLNQRLQQVATNLAPPSLVDDEERSVHQAEIEKYLQENIQQVSNTYHRSVSAVDRGRRVESVNPSTSARVTHRVCGIRSTVRRLDKVFNTVPSEQMQRHIAATNISMMCRAFVVRRQFRNLQLALGSWRSRKCIQFLTYLEQFAAREEFVSERISRMQYERTCSFLRRVLGALRDVVLMNLPRRMSRLKETENRFLKKQRNLLRYVFAPWKLTALGPCSRKKVSANAKTRHDAARQRLNAMDRFDVITQEMVHEEFLKDNIRQIFAQRPTRMLRLYFHTIKDVVYLNMKRKLEIATAYYRRQILTRVMTEWVKVFHVTQANKTLASTVHQWNLERYDQHFNLRKIDAHYRRTHMRKHIRSWAGYCQLIRRVRQLFEGNTKETLAMLLRRWHVRAHYQHALRENVVEEWHAYQRRIYVIPFRQWYVFMAHRRASRAAKESICVAYERRQRRNIKYNFFRMWKHQVLFGHVEDFHSKIYLLRSLEDQKRMCLGLEATAEIYRENIAALEHSVGQLQDKLQEKQRELAQLHETTRATRFGMHKAEQTIARVQGMLEAVRVVHPGTVQRIETMYSDNPLLSEDLKNVITLQNNKRRELLSTVELYRTELEVQHASKGAGTKEDQMLLHRVKWVLSRLDLGMYDQGENQQDYRLSDHRMGTLNQLCALFEFIRNGDSAPLTSENNPAIGQPAGMTSSMTTNSEYSIARRVDVMEGSETWHSFLHSLASKFVPNDLMSVKERLVCRAARMDEETAEIKANAQIHLYR